MNLKTGQHISWENLCHKILMNFRNVKIQGKVRFANLLVCEKELDTCNKTLGLGRVY